MELDIHAIGFCRNVETATLTDLRIVAEKYLSQEVLLDETAPVPHIQLERSQKYYDFFLVDALYKGADNKLYWYITADYEGANERIIELKFEDLPVWLIFACLKEIDKALTKG